MSRCFLPTASSMLAAGVVLSTIGMSASSDARLPATPSRTTPAEQLTLRLGFFPNVTHAPALLGVQQGIFAKALGPNITLQPSTFKAGPEAVEALFSDSVDAVYMGPNPTINAFAKSHGAAVRIIAGSTSGGAALVVKPEINSPADLRGKHLATPQLGNTQDVALRYWLKQNHLKTDESGGGDVSISPQDNAATLDAFVAGDIDGAWVPEPWATRLVQDGGGKVLVDEASLWPSGQFVTTQLVVAATFLDKHPDAVSRLLRGHLAALDAIAADPVASQAAVNAQLLAITGKQMKPELLNAAWQHLTFTADPIASSLRASAEHATEVGLLDTVDLTGIYDLGPLNALLVEAGRPAVRDG